MIIGRAGASPPSRATGDKIYVRATGAPSRFISYTYCIRHDLCNLCHRGMPSEVLHLCKLLLQEVRKLIFGSNLRSVLLARTLYNIK